MNARVLAFLLVLGAVSHSPSIQWSSFEWGRDSFGGREFDRAALMVPVRLEHAPGIYWMQLDTGCNVTNVYQTPFDELHYTARPVEGREDFIALSGAVGSCPFESLPVLVRKNFGGPLGASRDHPLIGTIGLDMLIGKVLVIDYPNRRFCLVNSLGGELAGLAGRASFVDVEVRGEKIFVPVRAGDFRSEGFFFDTGTSAFPVVTTKEVWKRLTGREGTEAGNDVVVVPSWGEQVTLVGAPVKGELSIGAFRIPNTTAYFTSTGLVETDGVLGNALFYDCCTVIVDLQRNRFGIVEGK